MSCVLGVVICVCYQLFPQISEVEISKILYFIILANYCYDIYMLAHFF